MVIIAIIAIVSAIALIIVFRISARRKRRAAWIKYLQQKYKKQEIVDRILNSEFWVGQTDEQLLDSRGKPHSFDEQVLKTKRKEVWKYDERRKGQFAIRITLVNGMVSGWDDKS